VRRQRCRRNISRMSYCVMMPIDPKLNHALNCPNTNVPSEAPGWSAFKVFRMARSAAFPLPPPPLIAPLRFGGANLCLRLTVSFRARSRLRFCPFQAIFGNRIRVRQIIG
jgi:hypothetical protein